MARIDASKLSEILTVEDVKLIMSTIGGVIKSEDSAKIVYNSICHNSNSFKLWLSPQSRRFYCHRCAENFNIYQLVMKQKKMSFPQALEYCCKVCGIPFEKTHRITQVKKIDDWESSLGKYLKNESSYDNLQTYDDSILNFFETKYHESWINEGITIETMSLFGIKWYPFRSQIIIPVYSVENELVGIRSRNINPHEVLQKRKYIPTMLANGFQYKFPTNQVLYGLNITCESIRRHKKIIIGESEKVVLKLQSWYGHNNISVATLGSALGRFRRDMIIELGVEEVILLTDKDYHEVGDVEYEKWLKKQQKLINEFKAYCKVSLMWDNLEEDLLEYKQNATDYNKGTFERLWESREEIICD